MPELIPLQEQIGRVGAYLLDDDHDLTLIDSLSKPNGRTVLAKLQALDRSVEDIGRIILTHAHVTHVKGAAALQKLSGAKVHAGQEEQAVFEGRAPSGHTGWWPQRPFRVLPQQYVLNVGISLWKLGIKIPLITFPPIKVDHFLTDGEKVGPVHVIKTPGHSPGSTSFYWPEMETLFTGDAIVTWPRFELGWKGLSENVSENVESVGRLVALFQKNGWRIRQIATGHGDVRRMTNGLDEIEALVATASCGS